MQVPPTCTRSIIAVFFPALAKAVESGPPACPAPMTMASYCVVEVINIHLSNSFRTSAYPCGRPGSFVTFYCTHDTISEMTLEQFRHRREYHMAHTNIKLYGTNWCSDCKRSKKFLGEQRVHYAFIDIEEDMEGQAFLQKVQNGGMTIPTIVFEDGSVLIEPTNAEMAAKLGLETRAKCEFYDLITVGGGPTALTAAIYAARDGYDVLVIERSGLGGQAGITERLDNYPGFPEGVTGAEFAERVIAQAKRYGVELLSAQNVIGVSNDGVDHFVETETGQKHRCQVVLLA